MGMERGSVVTGTPCLQSSLVYLADYGALKPETEGKLCNSNLHERGLYNSNNMIAM